MKGKDEYASGGRVKSDKVGRVHATDDAFVGGNAKVEKEAKGAEPDEKDKREGKKRGGKIDGKMAKPRMDRPARARGGSCAPGMAEPKKHGGHVKEHERPGRKAGGRVGADKAPLTEAANSGKPRDRHLMTSGMEP